MTVAIKRAYEAAADSDGYRILVDRLWPRGVSRSRAKIDLWLKDVAPSAELRQWWDHDPARMDEFAARYEAELDDNDAVGELRAKIVEHAETTLVYAAHDTYVNHARVLVEYLQKP